MKKNKNSNKTISILSLIFWLGLVSSEVYLGYQIYKLNMLPDNYLLLAYGVLAVCALLLGLLLLPGKKRKFPVRQIFGCILGTLVIAGCFVGSSAINQVNDTISTVTQTPTVSAVVDIYTLNENAAQDLDDMADYTFGITQSFDWENTQKTMAELEAYFGHAIATITYDSVPEMVDALKAGEVDALILNRAYVGVLEEMDGYSDFAEQATSVYEHTLTHEESQDTATSPTEPEETVETQPVELTDDTAFIVYLSGSDTRSRYLAASRSDVNILAVINTETKQILLVNTPRDYYVVTPASKSGSMDKLTHCGLEGPECSMQALEWLYDTHIRYYAQINFTGFETLIDAIGGVTVYSSSGFQIDENTYIVAGQNYLNGKKALAFARERYRVAGGDNGRGKNQMKIITAVIEKLCSGTTLLSKYSEILDSLSGMFTTNMTPEEISGLVKMQLSDMATWNIQSIAATGSGGSDKTFATGGLYAYVMYPHENVVDHISVLIDRVLNDEILTEADMTVQ